MPARPAAAGPDEPREPAEVVRIPPLAYLRSMWTLFWTAFRCPRRTTAIDLSTGRVVPEDETHSGGGPPAAGR